MAWHTEYGQALHQSAHLSTVAGLHASLDATRDVLLAGDPVGLLKAFPDGVRIDDQRVGRVEGRAALEDYCRSSSGWMAERQARGRLIVSTADASRVVGEFELELSRAVGRSRCRSPSSSSRTGPPGACGSASTTASGRCSATMSSARRCSRRTRSSANRTWSATTSGRSRRGCRGIVSTFEPDGCFREPAGDVYRVCGTEALAPFFARFFSAGGGIILEHCTVTEDGDRTALEFNAVRWGGVELPPRPAWRSTSAGRPDASPRHGSTTTSRGRSSRGRARLGSA